MSTMSQDSASSSSTTSRSASPASASFERFAGGSAVLSAICVLLSGFGFLLGNGGLSAGLLTLSGLFTMVALIGVYARLRGVDEGFAMLGLVLGVIGAVGATLHGGYDFALSTSPPVAAAASAFVLPSPTDPRGLLAGGFAGLGLLVFGWLITRGGPFARGLGYLACLSGALLVLLYVIRLFVLDAKNPVVLGPALISGFLLPVVTVLLGLSLYRFAGAPSGTR